MSKEIDFTVFTKPWKMPLPELGKFVKKLGFDGIELPIRDGYQVEPGKVTALTEAARILGDLEVKIGSIAGPTDEQTIAACAEAGIPIIRICVGIFEEMDYWQSIEFHRKQWDKLIPILEDSGVSIGIQNHCDHCMANAMQMYHILENYNPKHICAVWDAAHNALQGEDVDLALDIIWAKMRMVNLKNAFYRRISAPEAEVAKWDIYWTSGRQGRADWGWVVRELRKRGYKGDICLTAEYNDHEATDRLIAEDIEFVKSLFAQGQE